MLLPMAQLTLMSDGKSHVVAGGADYPHDGKSYVVADGADYPHDRR